jgi:hypothetical protein
MRQIVISIPEDEYQRIMRHYEQFPRDLSRYERRIIDGTPLPKGHGRLIDADALNRKDVNCANVPMNFIDAAQTIVEADKEVKE